MVIQDSVGTIKRNSSSVPNQVTNPKHSKASDEVLAYLSFTNKESGNELLPTDSPSFHRKSIQNMQGVLWKRRDVFRNQWRPRWFVLHADQGILTYYLLNESVQPTTTQSSSGIAAAGGISSNRRRTNSDVSLDTVDYDVVPRGSILLRDISCTVEANEALTRPEEQLYALTIFDHERATQCHLAARSSTVRDRWLEKIRQVIDQGSRPEVTSEPSPMEPLLNTSSPNPTRDRVLETIPDLETEETAEEVPTTPKKLRKWVTKPSAALYEGVPPNIVDRIENLLEVYLPQMEDKGHPDWHPGSMVDGVLISKHKEKSMVRSIYTTDYEHHPSEFLQLMCDPKRILDFETNVRALEVLRDFNPYTSFVYKAYHPVWPTSPRDFCSTAHWQVVHNEGEDQDAVVMVAFSCPEADNLREGDASHVRGSLHASMSLWRALPNGKCVHSRIIAYDLNGHIPKKITNTILKQQATLPHTLDHYLHNLKESGQLQVATNLEYETLLEILQKNTRVSMAISDDKIQDLSQSLEIPSSQVELPSPEPEPLTLWKESFVLLSPILLHRVMSLLHIRHMDAFVFFASALLCVRWVILQHLVRKFTCLPKEYSGISIGDDVDGRTTCQFDVNLDGVQRFVLNEETAKIDLDEEDRTAVESSHVFLRCVSKAMQRNPGLVARTIPSFPPVYIPEVVWYNGTKSPIWLPGEYQTSIQQIADYVVGCPDQQLNEKLLYQFLLGPACQVWTSRAVLDADNMDLHPVDSKMSSPICASFTQKKANTSNRRHLAATVTVCLTFQSNDSKLCSAFAEDIKQMIQFPEMCDS